MGYDVECLGQNLQILTARLSDGAQNEILHQNIKDVAALKESDGTFSPEELEQLLTAIEKIKNFITENSGYYTETLDMADDLEWIQKQEEERSLGRVFISAHKLEKATMLIFTSIRRYM